MREIWIMSSCNEQGEGEHSPLAVVIIMPGSIISNANIMKIYNNIWMNEWMLTYLYYYY